MQWNDDNKYKMSYCPKLKYTEHFLRMLAIFLDQHNFKCQEKTTNALDILNYFLPTFWNFFKNTNIWSNDMRFEVWTISTSDWSRWYWMIWMFWLVETSSMLDKFFSLSITCIFEVWGILLNICVYGIVRSSAWGGGGGEGEQSYA